MILMVGIKEGRRAKGTENSLVFTGDCAEPVAFTLKELHVPLSWLWGWLSN